MPEENKGATSPLVDILLPYSNFRTFNPDAYHLVKVNWSVQGCLTWKTDGFTNYNYGQWGEDLRRNDFQNLLDITCAKLKLRKRELVYYHKTEWGGAMLGHFHYLIGTQGIRNISPALLAQTMQDIWAHKAEIEPFDNQLVANGVNYVTKYEFDSRGNILKSYPFFSKKLRCLMAGAN